MYAKWHHLASYITRSCSSNVQMTMTTIVLVQVSALVAKPKLEIRRPL